jgi:alpha-glucoside transport system permease protein
MLENNTFRAVVSIVGLILTIAAFVWAANFLTNENSPRGLVFVVGLVIGIAGIWVLFFAGDAFVNLLPERPAEFVRPYVYLLPAIAALGAFLIYPAIYTVYLSFFEGRSNTFVGLNNYLFRANPNAAPFSDQTILFAFRNNILWIVGVTFFSVAFGLVIAVMVDRIKLESLAKSLIFMPMAISFVGAAVIWRFVYFFRPEGQTQIGLLNAIVTALGGEPQAWFTIRNLQWAGEPIPILGDIFPPNTIFLLIIMIWMQTGFAMVIISAAVKGVPDSLLEAARIDGANEVQIFFNVIIPYIRGTIITVATTILILVLKVFDIVFVMTSGNFETEVLANRMYSEMFRFRDYGAGSAIAVILMIAVIPIMIYNIREWAEERQQ